MFHFSILAALIVYLSFVAPIAHAQMGGQLEHAQPDDARMEIVGWFGGPIQALAVEGDLAVAGIGTRILVLDVTDRNNPQRIAEVDLKFVIDDLELRDGYAYIQTRGHIPSGNDHSFLILDLFNPIDPEMIFKFAYDDGWGSGGTFEEVELYGPYAYVLNVFGNMELFDVSNPRNTSHLGQFEWVDLGTSPFEIIIDGQYLYALDTADFFQTFDLGSDPFDPRLESSLSVEGDVTAMAVEGDYLVITSRADTSDLLLVYDVTFPWDPRPTGFADNLTSPEDVSLSNGYAFVADHTTVGWTDGQPWWNLSKGLAIYDIWSDPSMPELVGTLKTHGATRGVEVIGSTAYTFDDGEGLVLVDVENPAEPLRLGTFLSPTSLRHMTKVGDLLYVTDEWNGFTILNVANPAHPRVVGVYQAPELGKANHMGIGVTGDWAIFSGGYSGIHVVDVSDPSAPVRATHYPIPDGVIGTGGVEIDGSVGRIAIMRDLTNFDLVNLPDLGEPLGSIRTPSTFAYTIATTEAGVSHTTPRRHFVVDNSDPENPTQCSSDLTVQGVDVTVSGDYAYVADHSDDDDGGGFYIRDISDGCAMPGTVWYYPAIHAQVVGLLGSRVFFGASADPIDFNAGSTLFQFDVSNPESPVFLGKLPVQGIVPYGFGLQQDGSLDLLAESGVVYMTTNKSLAVITIGAARDPRSFSTLGR